MKIDGERIHHDGLYRLSTDNSGHRVGEELMVWQPGLPSIRMSVHSVPLPVLQLLVDIHASVLWHQPQRITGEVNRLDAVPGLREVKTIAKASQIVLRIETLRR